MLWRLIRASFAALWMLALLSACGGGRSDPKLQVDVLVDGATISSSPLTGGTTQLSLHSGQSLHLQGNLDIQVVDSLGAASGGTFVTRTSTTWAATLITPKATTATLIITSRDFPDLSATLQIDLQPTTLAVDVRVDGNVVNTAPIGNGQNISIPIRSGQTVALSSSVSADFSVDFGSARTSSRITTPTGWQSLLSSATATEVVLEVVPQGDTSRKATVKFQITPTPLSINVMLDGAASNSVPILAGETWTVHMSSGQLLAISSSISMLVDESLDTASKSGYTKTATTWSANLSGPAATTITLTVRSVADSTLQATVKVLLDPIPLSVSVKIAGGTPVAVPEGHTQTFTVQSGQTVVLSSPTLRINVSEILNNAQVGGRTTSPNAWGGALASATNTQVILTVVPQADSTRSVVIKLNVVPAPLQLTVTAAGTVVNPGTPVLAGQTLPVPLTSGSAVVIDSSTPVTVVETLNSATRSNRSFANNTHYSANFTAPSGSDVILAFASIADPTLVATVKFSVAPQVYTNTIPRSVNEFSRFQTTLVKVNGDYSEQSYTTTVKSVATDGSYTSQSMVGSTLNADLVQDAVGNLLSRTSQPDGTLCTYSPSRQLFVFPLYLGKTGTTAWSSSCTNGVSESASAEYTVQAIENVTIGASSVQALRIQINVQVINSNDPNLDGGSTGTASYTQQWTCKWAINLQRNMFCGISTVYNGTAPAGYPVTYTETMSQYSKP